MILYFFLFLLLTNSRALDGSLTVRLFILFLRHFFDDQTVLDNLTIIYFIFHHYDILSTLFKRRSTFFSLSLDRGTFRKSIIYDYDSFILHTLRQLLLCFNRRLTKQNKVKILSPLSPLLFPFLSAGRITTNKQIKRYSFIHSIR